MELNRFPYITQDICKNSNTDLIKNILQNCIKANFNNVALF